MSNVVELRNYTDFDRMLIPKNFIITLLGAGGAFVLSFLPFYVELPVIPYNLLLASALMIFVSIYTTNIASSILVAVVGSLGITSPDGFVDFFMGYLLVNTLLCVILGYYADKLQLVMQWTHFYLFFAALFSVVSIGLGIFSNSYTDLYWNRGIEVGNGGDAGTGLGYPVLDLAILVGLLLLIFIFALVLRGQIQLDSSATSKYRLFGILFLLLGQAATIVPLLLYSIKVPLTAMATILPNVRNVSFLQELFFHGDLFGVYGDPLSIFFIMAITTTLTMIGLSLMAVAKNSGNLEGKKGGSDIAFLAAPIAFLVYFGFAAYHVQNFLAPEGLFISLQAFPVFAAGIWTTYYLCQIAAWILLLVFRA